MAEYKRMPQVCCEKTVQAGRERPAGGGSCGWSARETEGEREPTGHPLGSAIGTVRPVAQASADTDRLASERDRFGYCDVHRDRPLFAIPAVGGIDVQRESPGVGRGVGDERPDKLALIAFSPSSGLMPRCGWPADRGFRHYPDSAPRRSSRGPIGRPRNCRCRREFRQPGLRPRSICRRRTPWTRRRSFAPHRRSPTGFGRGPSRQSG